MIITQSYCDRCGKPMRYGEIGFLKTYNGVKITKKYDYTFDGKDIELCPECFESFKEWMKGGEKE